MANTSSSISSSFKQSKQKQSQSKKGQSFLDIVFSWSLSDLLNNHLYKFQVEEIPLTFSSTTHYMKSFIYPLLEETHADLQSQLYTISKAPSSPFSTLQRMLTGNPKDLIYQMTLTDYSNYEPMVGDLVVLTEVKPKCIDDLARSNSCFLTAYVTRLIDQSPTIVEFLASDVIDSNQFVRKELGAKGFVVYLSNLTTNMRIWQALNTGANMNVIQTSLTFSPSVSLLGSP